MVLASFVAFFFFAAFYRAQPFVDHTLNAVKGFSEFIIFAVLLVSTVQQVHVANFAEEEITIPMYGVAQAGLCVMYGPVAIYYMIVSIREMKLSEKFDDKVQKISRTLSSDEGTDTTASVTKRLSFKGAKTKAREAATVKNPMLLAEEDEEDEE